MLGSYHSADQTAPVCINSHYTGLYSAQVGPDFVSLVYINRVITQGQAFTHSRIPFNMPQSLSSRQPPPSQMSPQISPDALAQVVGISQRPDNPSYTLTPHNATLPPPLPPPLVANSPCPTCGNQSMSNSSRYSQWHRSARKSRLSSSRLSNYPCLIPGCRQYFTRTDNRRNHLKSKHHLQIPKGRWTDTWISENQHEVFQATIEQEVENNILLLDESAEGG